MHQSGELQQDGKKSTCLGDCLMTFLAFGLMEASDLIS